MTYDINTITFLDIEAVPLHPWEELPEKSRQFFLKKFKKQIEEINPIDIGSPATLLCDREFIDLYNLKASLHAEWNRIVCVALGAVVDPTKENPKGKLFVRTFTGTEEAILEGVAASLAKRNPTHLCAHNGLGFDFPVLTRKYMLQGKIPPIFDNMGRKPWDMPFIDTQSVWAAGEWKYFVAQDQLAMLFGLESSKSDMDGSMVYDAFKKGEVASIATYCAGDVITLTNIFCRMTGRPVYSAGEIQIR